MGHFQVSEEIIYYKNNEGERFLFFHSVEDSQ